MAEPASDDWRGLFHAHPSGRHGAALLAICLLVPLALTLLFAGANTVGFARAYAGAFVVTACITGSFQLVYAGLWPRLVSRKPRWPARVAGHAISIAGVVLAGGTLAHAVSRLLWGGGELLALWREVAVVSVAIVAALVALDELAARGRSLERREASARLAALRAELSALQARTDPHFLFNSLNAVASLIATDPVLAESLLERLAAIFRYALDAGRRATVPLADEVAAVTAFLEVEALRLGDRLRWRIDWDDALGSASVPPLVLQPLVENAIRHGASARVEPTDLVVTIREQLDQVALAVEDRSATGAPLPADGGGRGGSRTSLADLESRLDLAYGPRARLIAGPVPPAGWRSEVVLPRSAP